MNSSIPLFNTPRYVKVLLVFTIINLIILATRNHIVGDSTFNYLRFNLLTGISPFIIALILKHFNSKLKLIWFILISILWLLFYPNSPYMISDLIHPHEEVMDSKIKDLIIYDTFIVFSIAILSAFYGFVSLKIMFNLFRERFGANWAHTAILFSLVLSCLGFYIGRTLVSEIKLGNGLLYSWEIFLEPVYIIKTVWKAIFPIKDHLPAYAMMGLFGFVQYQLLVMMKDVKDIEEVQIITKD